MGFFESTLKLVFLSKYDLGFWAFFYEIFKALYDERFSFFLLDSYSELSEIRLSVEAILKIYLISLPYRVITFIISLAFLLFYFCFFMFWRKLVCLEVTVFLESDRKSEAFSSWDCSCHFYFLIAFLSCKTLGLETFFVFF